MEAVEYSLKYSLTASSNKQLNSEINSEPFEETDELLVNCDLYRRNDAICFRVGGEQFYQFGRLYGDSVNDLSHYGKHRRPKDCKFSPESCGLITHALKTAIVRDYDQIKSLPLSAGVITIQNEGDTFEFTLQEAEEEED